MVPLEQLFKTCLLFNTLYECVLTFTSTHNRYTVIISISLIFWHAFSIYSANVTTLMVLYSLFSQNAQTL